MIESKISLEQTYKLLFEKLPRGLSINELLYDSKNRPVDYRIISVNKEFELLSNLSAIDIIGKNASQVLPELTRDVLKYYDQVIKNDIQVIFEDGSTVSGKSLEVNSIKIADKRFASLYTCSTGCKLSLHTQREINRLTMELKSKNRELEEFIFSASHDLRSPLVTIQGFCNQLSNSFNHMTENMNNTQLTSDVIKQVIPVLESEIPESIEYIQASVAKMDALLEGLLKLSRIGRGMLTINTIDMNSLLYNIQNELEYKVKNLNILFRVEKLLPCRGDHVQIKRVFTHLLKNALESIDPNRKGFIYVSSIQNRHKIQYCVEDNGIGISCENQKKIFNAFYRINMNNNDSEGLGLTIVKKIIKRHNGTVRVESELGFGTKFYVELPQ